MGVPIEPPIEPSNWTGRCVRVAKRGFINDELPPIARRLGIDAEAWKRAMMPHGNVFGRAWDASITCAFMRARLANPGFEALRAHTNSILEISTTAGSTKPICVCVLLGC